MVNAVCITASQEIVAVLEKRERNWLKASSRFLLCLILMLQFSKYGQLSTGFASGAGSPYAPLTAVIMARGRARLVWYIAVTASVISGFIRLQPENPQWP